MDQNAQSRINVKISNLDRLAAKAGDEVLVIGSNLKPDVVAYVNGEQTTFELTDETSAKIMMPETLKTGLQQIDFYLRGKKISSQPLVNADSVAELPSIPLDAEAACDSFIFKNIAGDLVRGSAQCSENLLPCEENGQLDCVANTDFAAVQLSKMSSSIVTGKSLLGIAGQANCASTSGIAGLNAAPSGTQESNSIRVTVSGNDVIQYKYKVRDPSEPNCADPSGYKGPYTVDLPIATNVADRPNGDLELCVLGMDAAGQWQAQATSSEWTKEATPPAATFSGEPSGAIQGGNINLSVAGNDVVSYKYKIRRDGDAACSDSSGYSAETPISTPIVQNLTGEADGAMELCVLGKDSKGVWQSESQATSSGWVIDTTPPSVSIADAPVASSNAPNLDVSVSGDNTTQYKYKIREPADLPCSDAAGYSSAVPVTQKIQDDLTIYADGVLELCIIGRDLAGNWQDEGSASSTSWTRDSIAPAALAINAAPSGTNNVSFLNATISGADVTHYKYKVKAGSGSCASSADYSDEVPVATAITNNISSLADGPVEVCAIGRDAAGNWMAFASATVATWTKDSLPPLASLSGEPTASSLETVLDVTVGGADVAQYRYKVRSSSDPSCADGAGYSGALPIATHITTDISAFADGPVEICVIGQDTVGNWQLEGTATIASWTKDTVAPTAAIANTPNASSNATAMNATVAGTGVTHYKFKLRAPADADCSNPAGYSAEIAQTTPITSSLVAFADDSIELCVIGRDGAGNWQSENDATAVSWTKDSSAPTASIAGAPSGTINSSSLNVSVGGAGVTYYKYKVRESASAACSNASGYSAEIPVATLITSSLSSLADGAMELCVIGRDNAGNWQSEAAATTASWTKDLSPPVATLSGTPSASSSASSLNVTVAGAGVVEYKYKVRATADAACSVSSGYSAATAVATAITSSVAAFADGSLQLCVIGKDSAGNWQLEGTATTHSWTKDTLAPTSIINDAPAGTNNASLLNVTISGTGVSHYKYKLRISTDVACSDSSGYSAEQAVSTLITDSLVAYSDGDLELCVIGRDAAGNWQTEADASFAGWTKDSSAPTAVISSAPSGTSNAAALNVSISGTGVSHYKYKLRSSADLACSNASGYSSEIPVATAITDSLSALAEGSVQLCVIGRDSSGNWQGEASATTASWTKDTVASAATLSGAPSGSSKVTSLDVTVAGTDILKYKYKIRQAADLACSNSSGYSAEIAIATHITDSIAALPDGNFELCVIGQDSALNWQTEATATVASWTKDTQAPTASISNAPGDPSNATLLNVSVAGTDVTYYKYKIRETADTACSDSTGYSGQVAVSSPITTDISGLADAVIEICVIGRDAASNWQTEATATAVSWTKDVVAPSASISGAPSGNSNSNALNVTVSGASVSHYKYKIRESADAACSNATGYSAEVVVGTAITADMSAIADGTLELCVIGRDAAGNWQTEASAATASWTKDALPPVAVLSGAPSGSSLTTTLDITVSGTDVLEYKYKIRVPADSACSDSTGYSAAIAVATHITDNIAALADGTIQVCVIARDAGNNWQLEGTATTASWTKDTSAPLATISSAPTGTVNTVALNVTIAGSGVSEYKYKVRDNAVTACSDSTGYSASTPVATPITSNISALADGSIELCVIGRDSAGNWQAEASATTATWTKDTAAPTATINSAPTGTNNQTSLNVTISGTDVSHYRYKVRESTDLACSNALGYSTEAAIASAITADISTLEDGVLELCVIGRDAAGNWQSMASASNATWTKDAIGPTATLSGAPSGSSLATSLNISVGGVDTVEYKYKIRESANLPCSNSSGYSSAIAVATHISDSIAALADGTIEVCVVGKDSSGNWQLESVASSASWTKDTVAPTANINDAPSGISGISTLDITIDGTGVASYKYKVRESADAACSDSSGYSASIPAATKISDSISGKADGVLELCVIGADSAGNWQTEASSSHVSWTKDTTAPTATISGAPSATNSTTVLNITIAGTGVTAYKYKLRVPADANCSDSSGYGAETPVATGISDSISALADGTIQLCVIGKNTFNIWQPEASATTASWTKDTTAPTALLSGAPTGSSKVTTLNVTVSGTDITEYKYKIRVAADLACSNSAGYSAALPVASAISDDIAALAEGALEICVIAKDSSGNWQTEASATSATWTKDTTAPVATINNAPSAPSNATALNVSITGAGVTNYKYKLRTTADPACSNTSGYSVSTVVATAISANFSALADGVIELCVIGRDSAGNWQTEAAASAVSWTKDVSAPTATISGQPTGTNNAAALNVTVAGAGVSHYKYKVRESADAACNDGTGYSAEIAVATLITSSLAALADDTLELCVIGRDAAGNWQTEASAATASWTKDTLPPAATLSGAPTGSSLVTSLNITVAGTDVVEYKYKIRESADLACSNSSGYGSAIAVATHITDSISSKADGSIEVCVIGKDSSGNWQLEGTATVASWTKDTSAPVAVINSAPSGTNNTTVLNVTINGTGVTHYKYKIRASADTACSDATDYSGQVAIASAITNNIAGMGEGAIQLCVIGRDSAGNWQTEATASTASWTKDTAAPAATINGEPTGTNNATSLNVTVAGTDVSHYKFKLRETADAACSVASGYGTETAVATPITASLAALGNGVIELCVVGRDAAGNWQTNASAATASWTKDTTAPTVNVGADKLVKVTTSIDATASDGGSGIATYAWTKISGPSSINFSAGGSEDTDVTAGGDGSYVLRLTVTDNAGNSAYDELNFDWDTTAPTAPSSVGFGSSYSSSASFSMSWTNSADAQLHFSTHNVKICTSNDCSTGCTSDATDPASPTNVTGSNGTAYYGCVQGEDSLGNKSAWVPSTLTMTVDTTPPTANSISINAGATYANSLTASLTLSATGASEMYVTNSNTCSGGGSWEAYNTAKSWTLGQSNSTATVYVKFRDLAGNESSCINDTIVHDGQAPSSHSISIDAGAASTTTTAVTLTLAASDTNSIEMYVTNTSGCGSGGSWEAYATSKNWTLGQTGGTATVYVAFRDAAGNTSTCVNDTITHIAGPPTSPAISIEGGAATVADTVASLTLSSSGASEMYVTNDSSCSAGGNWETYATSRNWTLSLDQNRSAIVYVKYRNTSGSTSCVSDTITVQSANLLTNGDFETGDTTAWTNTVAGKWVVDTSAVNEGTYSAHTSAVANSSNACLTQSVDLTAAVEDQIVDFTWSYGTQTNGDYAEFVVDTTTKVSLSGLSSGWVNQSVLLTKGASRLLKWCYRKNAFTVANGDYVRLDNIRVGAPYLMPPQTVSGTASNGAVALAITAPVAPPSGYLVVRGTSAVDFTPVNGTSYSVGALGSYYVAYKGTSTAPNITGLTNATTYYFNVYSYDASDNYSLATSTSATPWGNYTPSSMTATGGNAQVALSWSIPAGGAQTGSMVVMQSGSAPTFTPTQGTSYSVGAVTGGTIIYKNTGTSYTKTALTNGTTYYFKVWTYDSATNRYSLAYASANATAAMPCTGTSYGGYCWYVGTAGTSCNSTCSANSRSYNAAGTAATNCNNVSAALGVNENGSNTSYTGQDYLCSAVAGYTTSSGSHNYYGSGNTGNKTASGKIPVCACQ